VGILKDIDVWFEMLDDRNRTSHTYNETTAEQVFESACNLPSRLRFAINLIKTRYLDAVPEYGEDSESSQPEKGGKR